MELIILMQKSVFPKWNSQPLKLQDILKERLHDRFSDTTETKLTINDSMCGHRNSEKFRTIVRKIRDEKTTVPAVILSNHVDIPKPELLAQAEEHPENWIIFFTKYLRKGQNRRALRLDTNGSIIISDDELLTEITEKNRPVPCSRRVHPHAAHPVSA